MKILESETKFAHLGKPGTAFSKGFQRRLDKIVEQVDLKDKVILDQGCGEGVWLNAFSKFTPWKNIYGFDIDPESISKLKSENINIIPSNVKVSTAENLLFEDEMFDVVFSNEVLEHVEDDKKSVSEALRVLKPGGRFVVFTPNRGWPFETHGMFLNGKYIWGNIPFLPWMPKFIRNKFSPHVRNYSNGDIKNLFKDVQINCSNGKVLIIHGFNAVGEGGWRGWLVKNLRSKGFKVNAPDLPETDNPKFNKWLSAIESDHLNDLISGKLNIVAHSMGATLALKLAEKYKLKSLFLVAPAISEGKTKEVNDFIRLAGVFDTDKILNNLNNIHILYSENDPLVTASRFEKVKELLPNVNYHKFLNSGHFRTSDGYSNFPELLTLLENSCGKNTFKIIYHKHVFSSFDKLERKFGFLGKLLQKIFHTLEKTPFHFFGISHFVVIEKQS